VAPSPDEGNKEVIRRKGCQEGMDAGHEWMKGVRYGDG